MPQQVRQQVQVDQLRPFPGNPRRGNVRAIARSLERFGQQKPIVAQHDGTVLAGNHLLAAAIQLGWDQVWVAWWEGTDDEAKAFVLADNRTSELGGMDDAALYALLNEVQAYEADALAAASYGPDDLADLAALLNPQAVIGQVQPGPGSPDDLWPLLRFKVPPTTFDRWQLMVERHGTEAAALEALLAAKGRRS